MSTCPSCGQDNPEGFRFCGACGAELAAAAEAPREVRKTVTVLFCDVAGSTALGERLDPEALRRTMRSYFDELEGIVQRHGGTVEKFIGDAVMAVFGIPVSHEDDALRAVRAAAEMRNAVPAHGLEARIGVSTGEVVAGEGQTLGTGDAFNVAARLEQSAEPGEILVGEETLRLVRDAVRVEPAGPLALKGKAVPVEAYRLLDVDLQAVPVARHLETPLVGRRRELDRLRRDFDDVVSERACRLFTLLGPAGVGKSRLVAEFLDGVAGADVLGGRCLHYGEDITYWPLVEILTGIGVDPDDVLGSSPAETQLAFRRLVEARADERPQVIVLEDLQWAEPTFLDLVEYLADWSREAPILLLCVARPELLELRPGWGGGKPNATSVLLEPLGEKECGQLIETLLAGAELDDDVHRSIVEASEGNPLFVEEMLALVREDGDVAVPPTIHALLQARLDRLGTDERVVIERGAVEGKVFHRGAVAELAPDPVRPELDAHLAALVRRELIRPEKPTFPNDDAFRFRHLLIRDAAYESLPKEHRAELHERFADWLARHDLVERDEIVGYHLEQASRYRVELDAGDARLHALGERAAAHLGRACQGALGRGDFQAGTGLLGRAADLLPRGGETRAALLVELGFALVPTGSFEQARACAEEAAAAGDRATRAYAAMLDGHIEQLTGALSFGQWEERVDAALAVFDELGDELGLGVCFLYKGTVSWSRCRAAAAEEAYERALDHFERAGGSWRAQPALSQLASVLSHGPTPVDEAVARCSALLERARGRVFVEGLISGALGRLRAMRAEVDEARELMRAGIDVFWEAGTTLHSAAFSQGTAFVEKHAGDPAAAEAALRDGIAELERLGERTYLSTCAFELGETLYLQGGYEEAEHWCAVARDASAPDDIVNVSGLDALESCLLARRGELAEAERLARCGVEVAETTDFYEVRGFAFECLAETLALAGKQDEAVSSLERATAVYEEKGDVVFAARAREKLGSL